MNRANEIGPSVAIVGTESARRAPRPRPPTRGRGARSRTSDATGRSRSSSIATIVRDCSPSAPPTPEREPHARPDEPMPAEQDRHRRVAGRRRELAQPWVADPVREQEVGIEPVLGRGPGAPRRRRAGERGAPGSRSGHRRRPRRHGEPGDPAPSRSSSSPSKLRGGRRFGRPSSAPAADVRRPRSSTRARVRDRVCRSSQRRSAAEVRPATSSSALGSAAIARSAVRRSRTAPADAGSGPGRSGAPRMPSMSTRSSGESTSTASRRLVARSRTGMRGGLGEPAWQRVVAKRGPGSPARTSPAPAIATTSAEMAVVRERAGLVGRARHATNASRSRAVASGIDPAPRTTRPAGRELGDEPPQARAERRPVGGSRRTTAAAAPAARKPSRWCSASAPQASSRIRHERPRIVRRRGCEDEDGDGAMAPESSDAERAGRGTGSGVRGAGGERRRRRRTRSRPRSTRSRALPGARLRGVSRLYATEPVGVVDQPEFRNAVVALEVPGGTRRRRRARRRCWSRSRTSSARSGDRRASAGARARSTSTCSLFGAPPDRGRASARGPQRRPGQGDAPADRPARRGAQPAVRAGAAGRPRARPRAARLGRDGREAARAGASRRGRGRGPADRDLGRRGLAADRADGPRGGRRAGGPGRTCGPCRRTGPACSGTPSPASASGRRRRRTGRPGAARPS